MFSEKLREKFLDPVLSDEISADLVRLIAPKVAPLVETRDRLQTRLKNLDAALILKQEETTSALAEQKELRATGISILTSGGGDLKAIDTAIRETGDILLDAGAWQAEAQAEKAMVEDMLKQAEKALLEAIKSELHPCAQKYTKKLNIMLEAASKLTITWFHGLNEAARKITGHTLQNINDQSYTLRVQQGILFRRG